MIKFKKKEFTPQKSLVGSKIAGGNPKNERVENDFYATNPVALHKLLDVFPMHGSCLEPCVGQGHLAEVIKSRVDPECDCMDIVDRGYPDTKVADFLDHHFMGKQYDCIITNPPYSLAEEFIRKSLSTLKPNGYCAMFLKIQFLEGAKRQALFEDYPPKYIYVFRNRMATWNNGNEFTPEGKRWSTTFCHAWFIWQKEINTVKRKAVEPIVRWL